MRIKDIVTVTLLSLANYLVFMLCSIPAFLPVLLPFVPILYALAQGIIFFVIGTRVQKKGAFVIYGVIQGIFGFYIPYLVAYALAGLITEVILYKGGYGNPKALTISYMVTQFCAVMGSTIIPFYFALDATKQRYEEKGVAFASPTADIIGSWLGIVIVFLVILGAFVGALIGKRILRKHFEKASMVTETNGGS